MGDGYRIVVDKVLALTATLAAQQQPLQQASEPLLRAAGGLDTGDPGRDAETQALLGRVEALHRLMGEVHAGLADAVNDAVAGYQAGDGNAAAGYLELMPQDARPAGDGPPVS